MNKRGLWSFLFLCAATSVVWAATAPAITIRKGMPEKINIAIEPFGGDPAAAQEIASVLATDLVRSDWFNYMAPANAELVVRGAVSGNVLNGALYSRGSAQPLLQKSCVGDGVSRRSIAHQMADEIVRNIVRAPGIAQTKITFSANSGGSNKEIYVMDYDGANLRRVTNDRNLAVRPRWGPNRRTLAFTSYRSGWPDIYLMMDYTTGVAQRRAAFPGLNTGGAISPDGKRMALVLSKDGNPELYVMDLASGSLTRLTRTRQAESSPCWSPDGSQICFVSDRFGQPQLFVIPAGGGQDRRITFGGYKSEPDWAPWSLSPDLPDLCYVSRMGRQFQVCSMNLRTGEERVLTADGADNEDPTWAPDGRHIVFSKSVSHRASLYILDAFTGRAIELNPNLRVLGDCTTPAWSR